MSLLVPSATRDDRITRLEAQVAYLANRLGVFARGARFPQPKASAQGGRPTPGRGHRIEAIRAYRQATGASLKAAKRAVDSLG